jgi:hypothetical protein
MVRTTGANNTVNMFGNQDEEPEHTSAAATDGMELSDSEDSQSSSWKPTEEPMDDFIPPPWSRSPESDSGESSNRRKRTRATVEEVNDEDDVKGRYTESYPGPAAETVGDRPYETVFEGWQSKQEKRNPVKCVRELVGNPAFHEIISYLPERAYTDKAGTNRIYDKMWTGNWWATRVSCNFT